MVVFLSLVAPPTPTPAIVSDSAPEGLTISDWGQIRQEYERHRHSAVPDGEGYKWRNHGQQWLIRFDGRGFSVQPDGGGWNWGLELVSYGFEGAEQVVEGKATISAAKNRLSYAWDETVEEWFVNDSRGLEHGFTFNERPAGEGERLQLRLAVRGDLRAETAGGQALRFVKETATVVNYAGLKVWDAAGLTLPARLDVTPTGQVLVFVDDRGAEYPITVDPIAQQAYLKASNPDAIDYFGESVAISGDTVVVGARFEGGNGVGVTPPSQGDNSRSSSGAAYVFVRTAGVWNQQAYLKASNSDAFDTFGFSVAVSGNTVVVAAFQEDSDGLGVNPPSQSDNSLFSSGAVYVFVRTAGVWNQQAYLKASNTDTFDGFGESVAVSGDTVVVGARFEDSNGVGVNPPSQSDNSTPDSGAVYVFTGFGSPPVADAGPDQSLSAGGPGGLAVTLDGSGSMDPDGDPLTYMWSGPFGTADGVSPTVQIPGGVHNVTLTVDDGRGGLDSDTVTITVKTIVVSPSALAFTLEKGAGGNSQPFTVQALGGTVRYSIARTASWLDSNPTDGESSGEKDTILAIVHPGNLRPGTYTARLVVNGPGVIRESVQVTLIVTGDPGGGGGDGTPKPFENGVVDTADFTPFGEPGHAVARQSAVSIFGEDFVAEGEFKAESVPLPTMLGGVMVTFDGIKAGLFLVSPGLIIAQLPAGVTLPTATMVITNGGAKAVSEPLEIQVAEYSPGVFTLSQDGGGQAIVVHAGTVDLAAAVGAVGDSRPAGEGDNLTIYANGLGPLDPPLKDGHNSCELDGVCLPDGSNVVLHHTLTTPVIRIGGVEVPAENVLFSGSSPGSVAVNEIVFTMPGGIPAGNAVSLTVEIGGVVSKEVTMAVE